MKEKIIKLLLSGGRDAQIANELIKAYNIDISGEELGLELAYTSRVDEEVYYHNQLRDLYVKNGKDNTWFKLQSIIGEYDTYDQR